MIVGRDPDADIVLSNASISRKHAKLIIEANQTLITDLDSANGTVINGKKISQNQSIALAKEDMIKIGNCILKYLPAGEFEILFYGQMGIAAHTDPLTQIYNKGYLLEALDAEFKRAKALHHEFSILFFDIDHFKNVNDTYGHDAGDYVLKSMANIIRTQFIQNKEVFARYGGEEFTILLPDTSSVKAALIAENIRSAIETNAFIYDEKRLPITISIGVAEINSEIESAQTLFKKADQALYQSKSNGRNQITVSN